VLIDVPQEIKAQEYRVGMTPSSVREAVAHGHHVLVETQAGAGMGAGAQVVVIDKSLEALRRINRGLNGRVITVFSNQENIEREVLRADLVVSGVLIPGAAAPRLITKALLSRMKPGAVIVDVAIDQGGSTETSHPTTHAKPIYIVDRVVRYMVANMPGAVPRTSTYALNNATLPFVLAIADKGWRKALHDDPQLKNGLNVAAGNITCQAVAYALNLDYVTADTVT
jgi:alanine dehydrogenase